MNSNRVIRHTHMVVQPLLRFHRFFLVLIQLGAFALAIMAAFLLRFDLILPHSYLNHLHFALLAFPVAKLVAFGGFRLYRGWWRYVSINDLLWVGLGNLAGSALATIATYWFGPTGFPRSLYVIDGVICFMLTGGVRLAARLAAEAGRQHGLPRGLKRIIIYGAGDAGVSLLREIRQNRSLAYDAIGFVDDLPEKRGITLHGVRILGTGADLPALVEKHSVAVVLIAVPSATGPEMTQILHYCHEARVQFKTIPGLGEVIEDGDLMAQVRDVAVEDLLGRKPVHLEEDQIRASLEGKVVLVTGAAGSIGSEMCRQIARFRPAGIVGLDAAESPLFEIDREMRQTFPRVPFYPEIGSIQHYARVGEVLGLHRPAVVYHAAAYKHVPLMEAHVFEAVENNVFGTYNVALAAAEHGVDDFVMISSDKAVRPTNVMGATKRVAELLLLALQNGRTKYVAVRFGNVLGSNGSVIPIFKRQIAAGGPVTVTHPEMRRFFMTIPEACQLVLQAAAIGEGGQICVLDMGEPVRIVDLARNLILLSGLRPDEDIKIDFTGIRPGEKLYEELSTMLEDTVPTAHEKIRIFVGNGMPEGDILARLDCLREICEARDAGRLVVALKEIVLDYGPSVHLLRQLVEARATKSEVASV